MTPEELARLRVVVATLTDLVEKEDAALFTKLLDEVDRDSSRTLWTLLLEAREAFPDDPSAPGIQLSCLGPQEFYAAIHRFTQPYGEGRQVVAKVKTKSFTGAVRVLDIEWRRTRRR